MAESVMICGVGMVTPVGLSALKTCYFVRAGVAYMSTTNYYDKMFQPFVVSSLPDDCLAGIKYENGQPPGFSRGNERILSLGIMAIEDLYENHPRLKLLKSPPLFLGWKRRKDHPDQLFEALMAGSQLRVDVNESCFYPVGRSAGLFALNDAWQAIAEGQAELILVAGCDSYKDLYRLGILDRESRVKSRVNTDGFIPGEGACCLLLAAEKSADRYGLKKYARLIRVEMGFETGHLYSDLPYKGEGLAHCMGNLLSQPLNEPVRRVFSSMNGESHWVKEWGVSYIRNNHAIHASYEMNHPAEYFGDLGAGTGTVLVGLSAMGYKEGHLDGTSLVYASSDAGERVALLMEGAG